MVVWHLADVTLTPNADGTPGEWHPASSGQRAGGLGPHRSLGRAGHRCRGVGARRAPQYHQQSMVGRRAVLVSALAALLIGAAPVIVNFFFGAGHQPPLRLDLAQVRRRRRHPATSCPGLDAVNPLCYAAGASGADRVGRARRGTRRPQPMGGQRRRVVALPDRQRAQHDDHRPRRGLVPTHYGEMTALAGVVVLPLLLVSTLQAVFRQNAGQLIRAFFVQLPLALLLGVVAIQIVILCLSATDAMCTAVAGGSGRRELPAAACPRGW